MFESSSDQAKYYPPTIIEKIKDPYFSILIINIFKFGFFDPNYKRFIILSTVLFRNKTDFFFQVIKQ